MYYGLNLDRMGHDFTIWQAAACAACLPLGSALLAAIDPKLQYTTADYLVHRLGDLLAHQHIPYPWEQQSRQQIASFGSMPIDELDKYLNGTEWRDIDGI